MERQLPGGARSWTGSVSRQRAAPGWRSGGRGCRGTLDGSARSPRAARPLPGSRLRYRGPQSNRAWPVQAPGNWRCVGEERSQAGRAVGAIVGNMRLQASAHIGVLTSWRTAALPIWVWQSKAYMGTPLSCLEFVQVCGGVLQLTRSCLAVHPPDVVPDDISSGIAVTEVLTVRSLPCCSRAANFVPFKVLDGAASLGVGLVFVPRDTWMMSLPTATLR